MHPASVTDTGVILGAWKGSNCIYLKSERCGILIWLRGSPSWSQLQCKEKPESHFLPNSSPAHYGNHTGPLGEEFPAEKDFTVFVYLLQTVCLAVYDPPPPITPPRRLLLLSALGSPQRHAFPWHTPSCHKNASPTQWGECLFGEFWNSRLASSSRGTPETRRGSRRMTGVK